MYFYIWYYIVLFKTFKFFQQLFGPVILRLFSHILDVSENIGQMYVV